LRSHSLSSFGIAPCARWLTTLLGLIIAPSLTAAQTTPPESQGRAQLEAAARAAEAQQRPEEAFLLKTRLETGDFQEGDRILLSVPVLKAGFDTVVVRAGKVLQFQGMDDLSLEGVLRSELSARLRTHLAKYLKDPTVRAIPLLRLGVFGRVGRPNYYYTPADIVLPDVIMLAGGVSGDADMDKITIRRGTRTIWTATDTRTALADGLSLDRLSLRANDEIYVPQKPTHSWGTLIPAITGSVALIFSVFQFLRH
jgi:protein involved in polysaccharide export with SLBB domain